MPGRPLHVNRIHEIRRLKGLGLTDRQIAKALKCSRHTIKKYLEENFRQEGDSKTLALANADHWTSKLNWDLCIQEVLKDVPVRTLWEEVVEEYGISVDYSGFWKQLQKRLPLIKKSMVRMFTPGSRIEIDYTDGIEILDLITGEILPTQLFVGVLCYSRYVFAEFTFSQKSEDFLSSHVKMFETFGGIPQVLSPDNLKTGITKANLYEPQINPAYQRLAEHYKVAVVPARVRTPKDKAIVERTIQIFQRWFYFKVRKRTFTSLTELNQCLKEHLAIFHQRKHRILGRSRDELFQEEKAHLKPLPSQPYEVQIFHQARLSEDCHFIFEKNHYSAPFVHRGKILDLWVSSSTIDVYIEQKRIAFHARARAIWKFITDSRHYPPEHRAYAEATPQNLIERSGKIGPETQKLINQLLCGPYPLQHLRRAQGILALCKHYNHSQIEMASASANRFGQTTLHYLKRVLSHNEHRALDPTDQSNQKSIHRNTNPFLRGVEKIIH